MFNHLGELNTRVVFAPDIGSLCHGQLEWVDGGLGEQPPQPRVRIFFDEGQSILIWNQKPINETPSEIKKLDGSNYPNCQIANYGQLKSLFWPQKALGDKRTWGQLHGDIKDKAWQSFYSH